MFFIGSQRETSPGWGGISGVASFSWARVQGVPHGPLSGPVRPETLRSYDQDYQNLTMTFDI